MTDVPASAIHTATLPGINQEWATARAYGTKISWSKGYYFNPYLGEKSFYYLEAGSLVILHGAANGQVRNLICMRAGSLLNLAHVLGSSLTSFIDEGCRFYCLSDVIVWKFPGTLLDDEKFISAHPGLIINLMQSLGVRLLLMHNTVSSSGNGDAAARLARFCFNMYASNAGKTTIALGMPLTELANLLGMHRILLFRALRKLKDRGALTSLTREAIVIQDAAALRDLALL